MEYQHGAGRVLVSTLSYCTDGLPLSMGPPLRNLLKYGRFFEGSAETPAPTVTSTPTGQETTTLTPTRTAAATQTSTITPTATVMSTETVVPTATPTATPTTPDSPTVSAPLTPTASGTSTLTPTVNTPSPAVQLGIDTDSGGPGDAVNLRVSIDTSALAVIAAGNDLVVDAANFDLDPRTCRANPLLGRSLLASVPAENRARVLVETSGNTDPIPDGLLYTCTARIRAAAPPGTYDVGNEIPVAFDASGTGLPTVAGEDGVIVVLAETRACPGDCDGGRTVDISELVTGVAITLGNTPIYLCLQFDTSSDGTVTINEVIGAVGAASTGCPA